MSTPQQIGANRQNAQASTGPITEEGKQRSSQNATSHGFTGQTLVLSPGEKPAYEAHVNAYTGQYCPETHAETQLVQQLADLHWSIHQIFVQQANLLALMNAVTAQAGAHEDALATANAMAPLAKTLNTLNLYEQRRRRTADVIEARLNAMLQAKEETRKKQLPQAAEFYKLYQAKGEPWVPADAGFVCSLEDVEAFLEGQALAAELKKQQNLGRLA
jgi:hypothetical protein